MYGLLYEHSQLNPLTHDTLHEFFGHVTANAAGHLAEMMRQKHVVSSSGEDIYLPDVNEEERLNSSDYREHIKRLDLPITFIGGMCVYCLTSKMRCARLFCPWIKRQPFRRVTLER